MSSRRSSQCELPAPPVRFDGTVRVAFAHSCAPTTQATVPIILSGAQRGFRPFQLAVRLAQLVALDMDGGQGNVGGGAEAGGAAHRRPRHGSATRRAGKRGDTPRRRFLRRLAGSAATAA
jgi:hypothetical protein